MLCLLYVQYQQNMQQYRYLTTTNSKQAQERGKGRGMKRYGGRGAIERTWLQCLWLSQALWHTFWAVLGISAISAQHSCPSSCGHTKSTNQVNLEGLLDTHSWLSSLLYQLNWPLKLQTTNALPRSVPLPIHIIIMFKLIISCLVSVKCQLSWLPSKASWENLNYYHAKP